MKSNCGVFLHLGLFAVNDHIIGNCFLVELVNDFLLLRRGGLIRRSFAAFRCTLCRSCFCGRCFRSFRCDCTFSCVAFCSCLGSIGADLYDLAGGFDLFLGLFANLSHLRLADRCFIIDISFNLINVISSQFK